MLDVYLDPSAIAVDPLPDLPEALPEPETVRAARALRRELEEARHLKPAQARPPPPRCHLKRACGAGTRAQGAAWPRRGG